jgi:hypothetical protein
MPDRFSFDPATRRYRNLETGRLVSGATVDNLALTQIDRFKQRLMDVTAGLFKDDISLGTWEKTVAGLLKTLHIQQHKLGVGNMTQRDYGIVGNKLRSEYRFLRNFSADIAFGRLSENQIRARLAQYANAAWGSYQRGKREGFTRAGIRWEKRLLNSKVPCKDCPGYAYAGWVPAGFLPNIGENCECQSNCKCTLIYSFAQSRPQSQLLLHQKFGWIDGHQERLGQKTAI